MSDTIASMTSSSMTGDMDGMPEVSSNVPDQDGMPEVSSSAPSKPFDWQGMVKGALGSSSAPAPSGNPYTAIYGGVSPMPQAQTQAMQPQRMQMQLPQTQAPQMPQMQPPPQMQLQPPPQPFSAQAMSDRRVKQRIKESRKELDTILQKIYNNIQSKRGK